MHMLIQRLAVVLVFVLGACETPVQVETMPELTFGHLPTINLNVAEVKFDNRYTPTLKPPNVEHLFPTPLGKVLNQWASDRLRPVGASGVARLIISNAAATETALKKNTSFTGIFTMQQSHRYDLKVEATLEVYDLTGKRRGFAAAVATRSQTMREDVSLNQREHIWFVATERLIQIFDVEMEKNIRQHLVYWIR